MLSEPAAQGPLAWTLRAQGTEDFDFLRCCGVLACCCPLGRFWEWDRMVFVVLLFSSCKNHDFSKLRSLMILIARHRSELYGLNFVFKTVRGPCIIHLANAPPQSCALNCSWPWAALANRGPPHGQPVCQTEDPTSFTVCHLIGIIMRTKLRAMHPISDWRVVGAPIVVCLSMHLFFH